MTDAAQIGEILKQYDKHGWTLRRVLLCAKTSESLASASPENLFGGAPVSESDTDAAWFSRRSANGNESWELRRLTGAPFALIKIFGSDTSETDREQMLRETEKSVSSKR